MVDRRRDDGHGNLQCSFCGKSQKEVKKLIAGPTVYICDECIGLCNDIIAEEVEREESLTTTTPLPKPADSRTHPAAAIPRLASINRSGTPRT